MDKALRLQVLRAAVTDAGFLRLAWHNVKSDDFPSAEESMIAEAAIAFYSRYEEPVGPMLRSEVAELARTAKLGSESKKRLRDLLDTIQQAKVEMVSVKALVDKVRSLRKAALYEQAGDEIITALDKNEFGPGMLQEIMERCNRELNHDGFVLHDYFASSELKKRIKRRADFDERSLPLFLIDPLDEKITACGRGQLGMVMAPPGGGKGLFLVHMGLALSLQSWNVLHFTLEDPLKVVEDRYDACLTGIPLRRLKTLPRRLRKRFVRARRLQRGRLKIVDATDGGWSVSKMEQAWEQAARDGFIADAIIIDYDDEIECEKQFKGESARRFEFAEIYRRLRRFAKRANVALWVAAQPGKQAETKRVITGRDVSEDYSKIRKVFLCVTIGQEPEQKAVKYVYVPKNRLGRSHFGVNVVTKYGAAIFFDRAATFEWNAMMRARRAAA